MPVANTVFKLLLVAYALLAAVAIAKVMLLGPGQLPEPAVAYLSWWLQQPQSGIQQAFAWLGLLAAAISIVAALLMTVSVRWARAAFVVAILVLIAGEAVLDLPVLKTPLEYFVDSLLGLLSGAIIVFAYWSPASRVSGGNET